MKKIIKVVGLLSTLGLLLASCSDPNQGYVPPVIESSNYEPTDVSRLANTVWIWDSSKIEILDPSLIQPPKPNPDEGSGDDGSGGNDNEGGQPGGGGSGESGGNEDIEGENVPDPLPDPDPDPNPDPNNKPDPKPEPDPETIEHQILYLYFDNSNNAFYGIVRWTGTNGPKTYVPKYAGPYKADPTTSTKILFDFAHHHNYIQGTDQQGHVWDNKSGNGLSELRSRGLFDGPSIEVSQSSDAVRFIEKDTYNNQKTTYKWNKDSYNLNKDEMKAGYSNDKLKGPSFTNGIYKFDNDQITHDLVVIDTGTIVEGNLYIADEFNTCNELANAYVTGYPDEEFNSANLIKYNSLLYTRVPTYSNLVKQVAFNQTGDEITVDDLTFTKVQDAKIVHMPGDLWNLTEEDFASLAKTSMSVEQPAIKYDGTTYDSTKPWCYQGLIFWGTVGKRYNQREFGIKFAKNAEGETIYAFYAVPSSNQVSEDVWEVIGITPSVIRVQKRKWVGDYYYDRELEVTSVCNINVEKPIDASKDNVIRLPSRCYDIFADSGDLAWKEHNYFYVDKVSYSEKK